MKKGMFFIFALLLCISTTARADWLADAKTKAESVLEPVVGDIGAALSGGLYRYAVHSGMPSVDISVDLAMSGLSDDTKDAIGFDGSYFPAIYGGGRLGLPKGIAVFGRAFSITPGGADESISLMGVGAKYAIMSGMAKPDIAAIAAYHMLSAEGFKVNVISLGGVISKKLPVITPYAGLSLEMVTSSIDTGLVTLEPSKTAVKLGGGFQMRILPLTFIDLGASYISGNLGYNLGLGFKFGS